MRKVPLTVRKRHLWGTTSAILMGLSAQAALADDAAESTDGALELVEQAQQVNQSAFLLMPHPPRSTLLPYTALCRSPRPRPWERPTWSART